MGNALPRRRWPGDVWLSAYERRLKEKCQAALFLMGQLVDFMLTPFPQNTTAPFAPKMVPGLIGGYAVHPGGRWSGDYLVYEYAPFQKEPYMTMGQARKYLHRIKEVRDHLSPTGQRRFPLAERKAELARMPPHMQQLDSVSIFDPIVEEPADEAADGDVAGGDANDAPPVEVPGDPPFQQHDERGNPDGRK